MIHLQLEKSIKLIKTKNIDDKAYIYCAIRRKYLVLQPEEWVRQLILSYFIKDLKFPKKRISVERGIVVNGMKRRFDILLFDREAKPMMIVECKSHTILLDQSTLDQIARYNTDLQVQYLLVTNGMRTHLYQMDYCKKSYQEMEEMPQLS